MQEEGSGESDRQEETGGMGRQEDHVRRTGRTIRGDGRGMLAGSYSKVGRLDMG